MFADVVAEVVEQEDAALLARLREIEGRRRHDAAEEAAVLAELDRRQTYRGDGHASMWGLLRSAVGWSNAECRDRMRVAHLVAEYPDAGECLFEAWAPVANIGAIARGFANPRCGAEIDSVIGTMFTEACRMEFDDFKVIVATWERKADVDGSHRDAEMSHENRNAHVVVWNGVGHLAAQWGETDGLQNREILERFVEAEFTADWEWTVANYGDLASKSLMPRTDAQRRADALSAIFQSAASAPKESAGVRKPVLNVHIDHHTYCDLMVEMQLFPERFVDPFDDDAPLVTERRCHTDGGDPVDPKTALQIALDGYVRFVIANDEGVPIHWGRERRLFQGAARDAVMSLWPRCTHPGCRVRAGRSQADHTTEWSAGGETRPDNGGPRCRRHNLIKNHGYTTHRDRRGRWHTYRPDGSEIC